MVQKEGEICTLQRLDQQDTKGMQANERPIDIGPDAENSTPSEKPNERHSPVIARNIHTYSNIKPPERDTQNFVQYRGMKEQLSKT